MLERVWRKGQVRVFGACNFPYRCMVLWATEIASDSSNDWSIDSVILFKLLSLLNFDVNTFKERKRAAALYVMAATWSAVIMTCHGQ